MYRVISFSCFFLAAATVVYQVVTWQTTGHWPDFSVAGGLRFIGLDVPDYDWIGWDRVLATIFGLPLVMCFLVIGLVVELVWSRRFR